MRFDSFAERFQEEEERLYIMHHVLEKVFDGRFIFPPLNRLRRVLDCGYGCASWACAVAEEHPGAEVCHPGHIEARALLFQAFGVTLSRCSLTEFVDSWR